MKKLISKFVLSLAFAASVFADPDISKISNSFDDLGKSFASALPQVTGMQNIYADAFIGKIFPTAIPHFGGGVNASLIKVDTSSLLDVFDELGFSADGVNKSLVLPSASVDFRVGGAVLPFDVGFIFLKTPNLNFKDISLGFTTFGVDLRYALLEDGLARPGLSVGLGYLYNGMDFEYSKKNSGVKYDVGIQTLYTTVQISKKLIIATPFAGTRFMVSSHKIDWEWNLGPVLHDRGSSSSDGFDFGNIQTQLYAGCGFNFVVFQTTLILMADVAHAEEDKVFSGALSFRVKL
ncbi:hypothetical protein [Treponema sp.]|uniref:hypothetical protein n=1 Tax=Treponema sp. TaxID=166 RepID=UPI00298DE16F|nr:hypothetical protein [Treponema sp.]MCI6442420.1 hypothetical protein [Spirochaetia bacterium]MDY4133132.1 hypothetical protein [Treponema sp.]